MACVLGPTTSSVGVPETGDKGGLCTPPASHFMPLSLKSKYQHFFVGLSLSRLFVFAQEYVGTCLG